MPQQKVYKNQEVGKKIACYPKVPIGFAQAKYQNIQE